MSIIQKWATMVAEETHFPWKHEEILAKNKEKDEYLETHMEQKKGFKKFWPIVTSGAGLFSDGYVNNVSNFFLFLLFNSSVLFLHF